MTQKGQDTTSNFVDKIGNVPGQALTTVSGLGNNVENGLTGIASSLSFPLLVVGAAVGVYLLTSKK